MSRDLVFAYDEHKLALICSLSVHEIKLQHMGFTDPKIFLVAEKLNLKQILCDSESCNF